MQTIQRPVADLKHRGEWALVLKLVKKERPQYSCNFRKCVKEHRAICPLNLPKKFAPEIKVPAQKNQNCALSLFMA